MVCQVGSARLTSGARAIDDLHAWLVAQGDWVDLGAADELKPATDGTVEGFGRAADHPVGGWCGQRKGSHGRFGMSLPPLLEQLGLVSTAMYITRRFGGSVTRPAYGHGSPFGGQTQPCRKIRLGPEGPATTSAPPGPHRPVPAWPSRVCSGWSANDHSSIERRQTVVSRHWSHQVGPDGSARAGRLHRVGHRTWPPLTEMT